MADAPVPQIPVWNPEGALVTIPASEFDQGALAQGYREATPEEVSSFQAEQKYGSPTLGAFAGVVGAGNMLTGGLYGKALQAVSPDPLATQELLRGAKEAHPIASMAGSLAGVGVGAMIPGSAPSLIMKAGRGVSALGEGAATVAGRVIPAALGAATEGALFGLEDVVEKHFVGDPGLTAEKAAAEIGLSALIPGLMVGGGKLLGEAVQPLADRLMARGARAAETKALMEAAETEAKMTGSIGGTASDAYRKYRDLQGILLDPTSSAENKAAATAFLGSEEGAALREAAQSATLERAPELAAELAGKRGALAEFQVGKEAMVAQRATELQAPERLGSLLSERVIQRYGGRAGLGLLLGSVSGVGKGVGTALGLNYGPMKEVIKRIAKDPVMFTTLGRFLKSPVETLSMMSGLAKLTQSTDDAIASGVGAIFGGGTAALSAEGVGKVLDAKSFGHVAGNLGNLSSDLDRLAEETSQQTRGVKDHVPATTDALHGLAARGVQTLNGQVPRAQRQPLDRPYEPSRAELVKYSRAHEIAEKPTRVLQHIAQGTLSRDHLQALQAIYPRLYQEMQAQVLDRLSKEIAKGTHIPYRTRLMVGMFLSRDLDSTTTPRHMLATQSAMAKAPPPQPQKPLRQSGLAQIKMGGRMQTPNQSAAQRESEA